MKKLLSIVLALTMVLTLAMGALASYRKDEEDYQWGDFFNVDYDTTTLLPGQTYYFPCTWGGEAMTDEFFSVYNVGVTVTSQDWDLEKSERGDDYISPTTAKGRVEIAEFTKDSHGKYYFKFRAKTGYSYSEDVPVLVYILARDKKDKKYRSDCELYLDIGYSQAYGSGIDYVYDNKFDVDSQAPRLEFDDSIKECRLNFDNESYFQLQLSTIRKFNFVYVDDKIDAIVTANPSATLKFLNFMATPSFSKAGTFKFYAPSAKYLYTVDKENKLTLIAQKTSGDYFGFNTNQLLSYVASDIPLKGGVSGVAPSPSTESGGASETGNATVAGLTALIANHFSNRFVVAAYGLHYEALPGTVMLRCKPDLSQMNMAALRVYAFDEMGYKLYLLPNAAAKVGTDGYLYFKSAVKGLYVITDAPLAK